MKISIIIINLFCGIGALFGGALALSVGNHTIMGVSTRLLKNAPFTTFLIPALVLILIIGLGNFSATFLLLRNHHYAAFSLALLGIVQMGFILIQIIILLGANPLHLIFFLIGLYQFIIGIVMLRDGNQKIPFSANQN
ncbi:MAG: hypothetical protein LKF42_02565 [Streptococcaceae bacterium]|jgi:TRAP-type mannitol/chloroaromatic compound transport system permease large subunit|nr:hypothetical protein [Streptococcaceae bacterium]MCH4176057.1 hypothetical protein [Streptococcaceae bacterium]